MDYGAVMGAFTDAYMRRQYGTENEKPLSVPVEVDLDLLSVEERLALSELNQKELQRKIDTLMGSYWGSGMDGR